MRAGLLTEIIKVLRPQKVVSEYGEEKTDYIEVYNTRARLVHQPSQRTVENEELLYNKRFYMSVRYYVPVMDFDLIEWNGKRYNIISICPKREYNEIELTIELIND